LAVCRDGRGEKKANQRVVSEGTSRVEQTKQKKESRSLQKHLSTSIEANVGFRSRRRERHFLGKR